MVLDCATQPQRASLSGLSLLLVGAAATSRAQATFSEAPPISTSGGQTPTAVAADIDRDGDQDVVSAEYGANLVAWYENNGASPPGWTKRIIDPFASGPITVAIGDVDRDGDIDVFSANFNEEGVAWYENRLPGSSIWIKRLISGIPGAWGVHAADVDGDGDIDGIGGNRWDSTSDHIGVEWYDNNGAVPPGFTVRRVSAGFVDAASVHPADVDEDGDADILAVDVFRDSVYWYRNDGPTPSAWTQITLTNTTDEPWSVFPADLDRDGDIDVLTASAQDNKIAWFENDGRNPPVWTPHAISTSVILATAGFAKDLDGDSDPDVVSGAWANEIAWYESDGGTPPSFTRRVISHNCSGPEGVFAARLDPDAEIDILAACNILGTINWYRNEAIGRGHALRRDARFSRTAAAGLRSSRDVPREQRPGDDRDGRIRALPRRGLLLPRAGLERLRRRRLRLQLLGDGAHHLSLPLTIETAQAQRLGTSVSVCSTPNSGVKRMFLERITGLPAPGSRLMTCRGALASVLSVASAFSERYDRGRLGGPMNQEDAAAWVERYVQVWTTNAPQEIGALFTDDACYYTGPFDDPWSGRDAIVRKWLERQDAPGSWEFRYEILATSKDTAVVRGWTHYHEPPRRFGNLWVIRFGPDSRCREFTEWWMAQPPAPSPA